jgi:hypothetical protein
MSRVADAELTGYILMLAATAAKVELASDRSDFAGSNKE